MFCRWLTRYRECDAVTRQSIESIAKSVADGDCRGLDRDSALDCLDEWIFGENG